MKLFSVAKVGVFLDSITHKIEKRRDGEVKVLALGCRIHPFSHQLATAMDDLIRGSLFRRSGNADPLLHVAGLDFTLPLERQDIDIYASPDTTAASIRVEQVKVTNLRAKLEKGSNAYVCTFKLVFGPVSDRELAFTEAWRTTQRFLTFKESQPDLAYEEIGNGSDEDAGDDSQGELEMEDERIEEKLEKAGVGAARKARDRSNRKLHRHTAKKKGRRV